MTANTSSANPQEIAHFAALAAQWWRPDGEFRPLHKLNPVRLRFIRGVLLTHFGMKAAGLSPLKGLRLLDAGCGGGLVSEPLARMGAEVLGIDAGEATIQAARAHAEACGVTGLTYQVGLVETLVSDAIPQFDAVVSLEVIEHVIDPARFLSDCAALVRPGGVMIVSTINRTPKAFALAKVAAEYILGWVSPGTHDAAKFLKPEELSGPLTAAGLVCDPPVGLVYRPLSDSFDIDRDTSVNYLMVARRPA